jgi:hypothetical protein
MKGPEPAIGPFEPEDGPIPLEAPEKAATGPHTAPPLAGPALLLALLRWRRDGKWADLEPLTSGEFRRWAARIWNREVRDRHNIPAVLSPESWERRGVFRCKLLAGCLCTLADERGSTAEAQVWADRYFELPGGEIPSRILEQFMSIIRLELQVQEATKAHGIGL